MTDAPGLGDAHKAMEAVRSAIARASDAIRNVGDFQAALSLADLLREQSTADLIDVRFRVVVDQYVRRGHNAALLGEDLGLSRQRASAMIKHAAEKRGIAVPPKK